MGQEDVEKRLGLELLGSLPIENELEYKETKKKRKKKGKE
jgi:hypothetical protein